MADLLLKNKIIIFEAIKSYILTNTNKADLLFLACQSDSDQHKLILIVVIIIIRYHFKLQAYESVPL